MFFKPSILAALLGLLAFASITRAEDEVNLRGSNIPITSERQLNGQTATYHFEVESGSTDYQINFSNEGISRSQKMVPKATTLLKVSGTDPKRPTSASRTAGETHMLAFCGTNAKRVRESTSM